LFLSCAFFTAFIKTLCRTRPPLEVYQPFN
jgi:hypothetical protein